MRDPRRLRFMAYLLGALACTLFAVWIGSAVLRLRLWVAWSAVFLAACGLVSAALAWRVRGAGPSIPRRGLLMALGFDGGLLALLLWFLLSAMALPDLDVTLGLGTLLADPPSALVATDGSALRPSALRGRPAVLVFFRGHW